MTVKWGIAQWLHLSTPVAAGLLSGTPWPTNYDQQCAGHGDRNPNLTTKIGKELVWLERSVRRINVYIYIYIHIDMSIYIYIYVYIQIYVYIYIYIYVECVFIA